MIPIHSSLFLFIIQFAPGCVLSYKPWPWPFRANESDCPDFGDRYLTGEQVNLPWGVPHRALRTFPDEVELMPSTIPGAGLGVISRTFIQAWTWLGEYQGEYVPTELVPEEFGNYTCEVIRDNIVLYYIDGHDVETSNWARFINCPRRVAERNVRFCNCKGRLYFMTMKDVLPGQELMVYYGAHFAKELGIDPEQFGDDDF